MITNNLRVVIYFIVLTLVWALPAIAQSSDTAARPPSITEIRLRKSTAEQEARSIKRQLIHNQTKIVEGMQLYENARFAYDALIEQMAFDIVHQHSNDVRGLVTNAVNHGTLLDQFVHSNTKSQGVFDWIAPSVEGLMKAVLEYVKYFLQRGDEERKEIAEDVRALKWMEWSKV